MAAQLDSILTHLGTGKWTIIHFIIFMYEASFLAPNLLGGALLAPRVDYSCRVSRSSTPAATTNVSILLPNSSLPMVMESNCEYRIDTPDGEKIEQCVEFDFDNSTFSSTFTSEYNLVCDQAYLQTLFQSIHMFGILVGSPINGYLSDKYGRKTTLLVAIVLYLALGIGSAWLPFLSTILAGRFLLGCLYSVCCFTTYIHLVEIMEPKRRSVAGFAMYIFWGACTMMFGCFGYLFREWRMLQTMATLPGVLILPTLWLIDESPRWLIVKGRTEEAIQILNKVARWHGVTLPPEEEMKNLVVEEQTQDVKTAPQCKHLFKAFVEELLVLVRTPRLRTFTLCSFVNHLLSAMIFFGMSLSGTSLSDDPYLYIVLMGVVDAASNFVAIPLVERFGRKRPLLICLLISGISILALAVIPKGYATTIMVVAMVGNSAIAIGYQTCIFFSTELFPTEVRSRGVGVSVMGSRIGSIVAPFITDLVGSIYEWAPFLVFGLSSLVACILYIPLPETRGQALLNTVAQLEERQTKKAKSDLLRENEVRM